LRLFWGGWCILFLIGAGCASAPPIEDQYQAREGGVPSPPSWVTKLPRDSKYVYAVGMCPKTYYQSDAEAKALESARAELAKSISIRVKSTVIDSQNLQGQTGTIQQTRSEQSAQVDESVSEAVLNFSEVMAYWLDKEGAVGEPLATYCLVRIPREKVDSVR